MLIPDTYKIVRLSRDLDDPASVDMNQVIAWIEERDHCRVVHANPDRQEIEIESRGIPSLICWRGRWSGETVE